MRIGEASRPGPDFDYSEIDAAVGGSDDELWDHEVLPELQAEDSDDGEPSPPRASYTADLDSDVEEHTSTHGDAPPRRHGTSETSNNATQGGTAWMPSYIPAWDWLISQPQLITCRAAELAANCTINRKEHNGSNGKRWKKPKTAGPGNPSGHFTAAGTCRGSFPF